MNTNPRGPADEPEVDDLEGLRARGEVGPLLELAKSYRASKDLQRCFAAYKAAAELGSGEAAYAVALFHLAGGVVPQDLREGATQLRAAAEKGSIPAKVYLGNLYELGIHYKADPEKADVWYRNAARSAGLAGEPLELAELGCVRHVLAQVEDPATTEADRTRLLARARAHGHGLRVRDSDAGERPTLTAALQAADVPTPPAGTVGVVPQASSPVVPPTPKPRAGGGGAQVSAGLSAFGYAALFIAAGIGGGYAAMLGAHEMLLHGKALPYIGGRFELVFPIAFAVVGVLPSLLVYRFATVVKALFIAVAVGGAGWVAWGTGTAALHATREVQAMVFAVAGFAAGLLVLGLLGGTKNKKKPQRRR